MSWRSNGITGSNNVPLGTRRRFGSDRDSPRDGTPDGYNPSQPSAGISDHGQKRGRSPTRTGDMDAAVEPAKPRKRKNRWGDATDNKAAGLMGLPTMIQATMTSEQLDAYTVHLRIEEISQKLRINDVVPSEKDRSPSPPPQYDNSGKRVNTREQRYRKKLEDERHKLIEKAMKIIPNYHPPSDYRRPTKTQEKVYVPVNDYPEINFIGLLIGPRGNTLKKMETESQAKIAIRGKGSVKEGKGRSDAAHSSNQEEDLHCLIMADTEEKVNKAKKLIHNVIETAASIPEGQNELKRNQLRELAALNGTLRDDENQACQNCGEIGHRKYDCPQQKNFTASIICRVCGNSGHMARDCPERVRGTDWRNGDPGSLDSHNAARITGGNADDDEYESLMQSLGGGGGVSSGGPQRRLEGGPAAYDNNKNQAGSRESNVAPWRRAAAPPWQQQRRDDRDGGGSRPWSNGGQSRDQYGGNDYQSHRDHYGGYNQHYSGYESGAPGASAPWHQQQQQPPPPPPPGHGYGNYGGGYPGYGQQGYDQGAYQQGPPGYGDHSGYGHGMAQPPPPPPPGLGPLFQNYGHSHGSPPAPGYEQPPPPPPPGADDVPPPPPPPTSEQPPPPPPPEA